MEVIFRISNAPKQILVISTTTTVRTARHIFSILLRVPESSLTFIHLARPLPDTIILHSLDFSTRNFITIHVKKVIRHPIIPRDDPHESSVEPIVAILQHFLRDVRMPFRDYLLSNPSCLPDLLNSVATNDPTNGAIFFNNPQLLLALFGITPDEFREALNRS
jgi:hypothetical protein